MNIQVGDKIEITERGLALFNEDDYKVLLRKGNKIVTVEDLYPITIAGVNRLEAYCEGIPGAILGLEGIHWNKV